MKPNVKKRLRLRELDRVSYKKEPKHDFLKNWSVIRRWAVINYGLKSQADLEMLLFLRSEHLFTRSDFEYYANFIPWDKYRLRRLMDQEFIFVWRRKLGRDEAELLDLTIKAKRMIDSIYKKLLGLEPIPESERRNRCFGRAATFSEKTLGIAIKDINQKLKQRPSLEEQKASLFQ